MTACAQENLTAVRVVRAFGREKYEEDKFQAKERAICRAVDPSGKAPVGILASGTLLTCLQVMVIILAGIHESVAGAMTLGASWPSSATTSLWRGLCVLWAGCCRI